MYRDILARIRSENGALKAFTCIADDESADVAASHSTDLPLAGIPVAVKDLIDTADMPTSYGSAVYAGHRPGVDAAIVSALKNAGAFIVGKTTTTEFATWPPTPTVNPRNPAHTPGGSSAGSAAAVAAGLVPAALGTQTKGSVIRPASFCGIVGFKPSFNRLPRAGVKMLAESLDTVGLLTCDVAVAERIYVALTGDLEAPAIESPRLAFCRTPQWGEVSDDARAAYEAGLEQLRSRVTIHDIDLPESFAEIPALTGIVHDYEVRRSLLPEVLMAAEKMDRSLVEAIEDAERLKGPDHALALDRLTSRRAEFAAIIEDFDAILCPAAPGEAPLGLGSTGNPIMNMTWTALHVPCITLPAFTGRRGLPVGLQLVGGQHEERRLLRAASFLERVLEEMG